MAPVGGSDEYGAARAREARRQMLVDIRTVEPALIVVQRQGVDDRARDRQRRRQDELKIVGVRHRLPGRQDGQDADGAAHDPAAPLAAPARQAVGIEPVADAGRGRILGDRVVG